jgi:hypothetical protein
MKISLSELDVIYISYDEPNADENWADLLNKCPWAKRSHGVFGSDACHKAAAALSETERFIGIDGDNIINPEIFNVEFDEQVMNSKKVFSWAATNIVNGLVYGNGGIKAWPVEYVMNMNTHECADKDTNQVDFCWTDQYVQINKIYSDVYNNASPLQAYRAGFREGVKMGLEEGVTIPKEDFFNKIYPDNLKRLLTWCSLGADVENGLWCIYGARLGCYMTNLTDWDYTNVRDFEYHTKMWNEEIAPKFKGDDEHCFRSDYSWNKIKLIEEISKLGKILRKDLSLNIRSFTSEQSKFIKEIL